MEIRGVSHRSDYPAVEALSRSLRYAAKILYKLCFLGLLCPTKPSKRAVHGAVSPCPGVHAGAFLRFMGIILQYLSRCASRSFGSTSAGGKFPVRRSPSLKILSILQINFQLYFPLYCIFPQHTRHQPHIPRERIHPPPFQPQRKGRKSPE